MDNQDNLTIRKATIAEDSLVARHFYQLWLDNNVSSTYIRTDCIRTDWLETTTEFIIKARQELSFQAFVAVVDNKVVGSASCQLFAGLYPSPFTPDFRQYGYIWNVFVESDYRRRGIAKKLTQTAVDRLCSLDCTHAILHASPYGKPLYESLGFVPKNEMILEIVTKEQ